MGSTGALGLSYRAPNPLASRAFARYFRSLFRKHFASVQWSSIEDVKQWDRSIPTLFIANHTNWWDGFFSYLVGRELGLTFHILMEARHLERYRVFRAIGTLPLRRDSLRGAWEDLAAAREALRPGVGLWIYPQGRRRDASEPVTNIERGAAHLAVTHRGPLRICPVAFRYAFESEQLPEAFALIGKSWMHEGATNRREVADQMEKAMNEVLVQLDARRREKSEGDKGTSPSPFTLLSSPRLSLNKQLDRVRHRLGLLKGDFDPRNG